MDRVISLDKSQRKALMDYYTGDHTGKPMASIRCNILLLLDDGWPVDQVQRVTYTTAKEVNEAITLFRAGGVEAVIQTV